MRASFVRLGLDLVELEKADILRINDAYTDQIGLSGTEERGSFKMSDWSISQAQRFKSGVSDSSKRRLHIDDNTGILLQYNDEKAMLDVWRTRIAPAQAKINENVSFWSLITGVASDSFYRRFEDMCDGVIDFKIEEKEGRVEQFMRVGSMRGRPHESRWRQLQLHEDGAVTLAK